MSVISRKLSEPIYALPNAGIAPTAHVVSLPPGGGGEVADFTHRFGVTGDLTTPDVVAEPNLDMRYIGFFYSDFFNRVYAIPPRMNLIDPVTGGNNPFQLFNASEDVQALSFLMMPIGTGIEITGTQFGLNLRPMALTTLNVVVTPEAPPTIQTMFTFVWEDVVSTPLQVFLSRTNTLAVPPETPLNITYSWKTDIATARDGTEQRSSIRQLQRVQYDMSVVFDTDAGQNLIYRQFFSKGGNSFTVPIWETPIKLSVDALQGDTSILINNVKYDVQPNDQLLLFRNDDEYETVNVLDVVDETVYLFAPLQNDFAMTDRLYRTTTVILPTTPKLARQPFAIVQSDLTLRETTPRRLWTGDNTSQEITQTTILTDRVINSVTPTMNGVPIVNSRPIVRQTVEDNFDWNYELTDYESGTFTQTTARSTASVSYSREYYVRYDYQVYAINALLNWMHGMRKPVWLPTWMNELRDDIDTAVADTITTKTPNFGNEYKATGSHRGLWIAYKGGWIARKIVDSYINDTGNSIIKISPALPVDFPLAGPFDIGHLVLCRLGADEVKVEKHPVHAFYSMTFTSTFSTSTDA